MNKNNKQLQRFEFLDHTINSDDIGKSIPLKDKPIADILHCARVTNFQDPVRFVDHELGKAILIRQLELIIEAIKADLVPTSWEVGQAAGTLKDVANMIVMDDDEPLD